METICPSHLLHAGAGTCSFCRQKAGILSRAHRDCQETFKAGWTEMVNLAADAARTHKFDEKTLRLTLAEIARRSHGDGATANQALLEGWKQGVAHAIADGIISPDEEDRLKEFENQMALMTVLRIQAPQYGPHKPQRVFDYPS